MEKVEGFKMPILFCIWARPELTEKVFERIREIKPSKLYVAADGWGEKEKELCQKARDTIKIDWNCDLKTLYREENLGCKYAMSEAISWFFEREEMGIILEDDCYPDITFFPYCEELLNKYKHDTRSMHISGRDNENDNNFYNGEYSYYYGRRMHCWGWASWRRAWKYMDLELKSYPQFEKENAIDKFIFNKKEKANLKNKFKHLYASKSKKTWAWPYAYSLLCQGALCINPRRRLVKNIGINSEMSVNYNDADVGNDIVPMVFPLRHQQFVGVDPEFNNPKWNSYKKTGRKCFSLSISDTKIRFVIFWIKFSLRKK